MWAECDGIEAARAARAYEPTPAIVVASGSGSNVHAYWPLKQPLSPPDAEVVNLRLAYAIGADRVCFDAARILRPPGTWNHKHSPPTPVRALRLERDVAFSVARRRGSTPRQIEIERVERRWTGRVDRDIGGDPLLRIPPAVYVSELLGVPARPGRKVHCPFHDDATREPARLSDGRPWLVVLLVRTWWLDLRPGRRRVEASDPRSWLP